MASPREVPFARESGRERQRSPGLDFAPPIQPPGTEQPKPPRDSAPSPSQVARANDLFLRGALTPEQVAQARSSRRGFEIIIGKSNFLPAAFLDIGAATSRATGLIRASGTDFLGRPGSWSGTGFLIAPSILVTNHHVLNSRDVAAGAEVIFDFQLDASLHPRPTRSFRLRPDRLYLTSPVQGGLDYTFCWVDGEPGREFGTVHVNRRAFVIAEEETANVISHPQGRMKEISIQQNEVQWQDQAVVHYTSDTEPGSSGASVCNNNWQLIALHHASKPSNVAAYSVLNEGIKLSAIATDLERQTTSGTQNAVIARELLSCFEGTDERLGFFGALGRRGSAADGVEAVVDTYYGADQDIDIGFWNVEWLTKHYDSKAVAVARVFKKFNLDVWCLEESSPNAAAAVVAQLAELGMDFETLPAEPESEDGKQSCTLLWNKKTMSCQAEPWGETIEEWLQAKSTDFEELGLGLEAVHGKIFDRYPALFRCKSITGAGGAAMEFHLVPVHLKAMDEGSLRRQMASTILAEAVKKKIEDGVGGDWIIGGDFNAELATEDFATLSKGGMVPASAVDEEDGSISYIKGPKSLIDHIFLSPNLAQRFGPQNYFIVAAEKQFPNYIDEISDHRPVLFRMSLNGGQERTATRPLERMDQPVVSTAIRDLQSRIKDSPPNTRAKQNSAAVAPATLEYRGAPDAEDYSDRTGYDPRFLDNGETEVTPPMLPDDLAEKAVVVDEQANGMDRYLLPYTHFSVVMNSERRMAYFTAVNIDGTESLKIPRKGNRWYIDPRIPAHYQVGNELYRDNDLDRGHMVRRLDPVWGQRSVARTANEDTFHYTNACPQHKDLNQKEWNDLEDYILDNAGAYGLRVCVFTGPVLRDTDRPYRDLVLLPEDFWKVAVIVRESTGRLSATGYVLTQKDMIADLEFAYGAFRTYQVSLRAIERMTGLDFGSLKSSDPKGRRDGVESAGTPGDECPTLVSGPESLVF